MNRLSALCSFKDPSYLKSGVVWSHECPLDLGQPIQYSHECFLDGVHCPHCQYIGTWESRLMVECSYEEDTHA